MIQMQNIIYFVFLTLVPLLQSSWTDKYELYDSLTLDMKNLRSWLIKKDHNDGRMVFDDIFWSCKRYGVDNVTSFYEITSLENIKEITEGDTNFHKHVHPDVKEENLEAFLEYLKAYKNNDLGFECKQLKMLKEKKRSEELSREISQFVEELQIPAVWKQKETIECQIRYLKIHNFQQLEKSIKDLVLTDMQRKFIMNKCNENKKKMILEERAKKSKRYYGGVADEGPFPDDRAKDDFDQDNDLCGSSKKKV